MGNVKNIVLSNPAISGADGEITSDFRFRKKSNAKEATSTPSPASPE